MNQIAMIETTHIDACFNDLNAIRKTNPLVHNVTNWVVMQTTANILLAAGASPIMAHAEQELDEIAAIANATVINIGTLDVAWIHAMKLAQHAALKRNIPVILDPVGAGATRLRTETAKNILDLGVNILRGNASEILSLAHHDSQTKGVDSLHATTDALSAAKEIANKYNCIVVVSGKTDVIIDATREIFLNHGTPLFTKVTGMGCSATALIGAFAAVNQDYFLAATHAMAVFTMAGEIAAKKSQGPATFYNALIDTLYHLERKDLNSLLLENHSPSP